MAFQPPMFLYNNRAEMHWSAGCSRALLSNRSAPMSQQPLDQHQLQQQQRHQLASALNLMQHQQETAARLLSKLGGQQNQQQQAMSDNANTKQRNNQTPDFNAYLATISAVAGAERQQRELMEDDDDDDDDDDDVDDVDENDDEQPEVEANRGGNHNEFHNGRASNASQAEEDEFEVDDNDISGSVDEATSDQERQVEQVTALNLSLHSNRKEQSDNNKKSCTIQAAYSKKLSFITTTNSNTNLAHRNSAMGERLGQHETAFKNITQHNNYNQSSNTNSGSNKQQIHAPINHLLNKHTNPLAFNSSSSGGSSIGHSSSSSSSTSSNSSSASSSPASSSSSSSSGWSSATDSLASCSSERAGSLSSPLSSVALSSSLQLQLNAHQHHNTNHLQHQNTHQAVHRLTNHAAQQANNQQAPLTTNGTHLDAHKNEAHHRPLFLHHHHHHHHHHELGPVHKTDSDDLDRIRNFIEQFKARRGALGLTQKQAAQCFRAYTNDRYAFSDNFVGHFEGFQFRPQTAMTIADSLAEWLEFAENETRSGRQLSFMPGKVKETRKRKYEVIRIRDSAKRVLVEAFERNKSPSTSELEQLSRKTNIPSRNIEIFFKNRRTSRQYHQ